MHVDSNVTAGRDDDELVVGTAGEIPPGEHRLVRVRSMQIGVYNVNGTYYALHSQCPHQYGPLCNGRIGGAVSCTKGGNWQLQLGRDGEILSCPWHGIEFDLKTGRSLAVKKMRVRTFPVRVVEGEVRLRVAMRPENSKNS